VCPGTGDERVAKRECIWLVCARIFTIGSVITVAWLGRAIRSIAVGGRMKVWRQAAVVVIWVVVGGCAYSMADSGARPRGLTSVHISVVGDTTESAAVVLDAQGRRCGWENGDAVRKVPGCGYSGGWDEGIPDGGWSSDLSDSGTVEEPLKAGEERGAPRYHQLRDQKARERWRPPCARRL
jgi:hypothetical protein